MPGSVSVLTPAKVSGFARHPALDDYPVVVHVVFDTQILCSGLADQAPPSTGDVRSSCWFNISLSDFKFSDADLRHLAFLIGETDELLETTQALPFLEVEAKSGRVVEDILYANSRRVWVTGATYLDAANAGLPDADIIDLLYRDILGRPADPDGLANYLFQRREGIKSLSDIRKSILESREYSGRKKEAAWAPGAIFSNPIALLAVTAAVESDDAIVNTVTDPSPEVIPTEPPPIDWPSYPERIVAVAARRAPDILEVALPVESVLFGSGWHNVEYLHQTPFRWMENNGVIFSPKPELPWIKICLSLAAVYGSHIPMIDCYVDDVLADVRVEERGQGFLIVISPLGSESRPYTKLRIESRVSGCPVREDRGDDQRVLSLNVLSAVVCYEAA